MTDSALFMAYHEYTGRAGFCGIPANFSGTDETAKEGIESKLGLQGKHATGLCKPAYKVVKATGLYKFIIINRVVSKIRLTNRCVAEVITDHDEQAQT